MWRMDDGSHSGKPGRPALSGTVRFISANGTTATQSTFWIPPHGAFKLATSGTAATTTVGSVRPNLRQAFTPSGLGIFSFRKAGITVAHRRVCQLCRSAPLLLVRGKRLGTNGICNCELVTKRSHCDIRSDCSGRNANRVDGVDDNSGNGQVAMFLNEIPGFGDLPRPFQGILRTQAAGISVVGLPRPLQSTRRFSHHHDITGGRGVRARPGRTILCSFGCWRRLLDAIHSVLRQRASTSGSIQFFDQSGRPLTLPFQ